VTRGTDVGERERESQRLFWERWGDFFDARTCADARPRGALRVAYVTEDTGVGGGHRDIFEHLNGLVDRGHEVSLYTLGGAPTGSRCAPVHSFEDYDELVEALAIGRDQGGHLVEHGRAGVAASVVRGMPVYFVQDIETSYYPDDERARHAVLDSYRPEFRYMTISSWNRERLRELGLDAELIPPGIDLETSARCRTWQRREDMVLALGRSNPLKNLPLTLAKRLARAPRAARPSCACSGSSPSWPTAPGMRYVESPDDEQVNELFNQATVFVQTSVHEGFALPPLEAMATGGAVVCTDAHGNRDFCVDGENCLMPEPSVAGRQRRARAAARRSRAARAPRAAGIETAPEYAWERRIDALERSSSGWRGRGGWRWRGRWPPGESS
jgi:glycosyltransferase involved in cell wall biosynthesis